MHSPNAIKGNGRHLLKKRGSRGLEGVRRVSVTSHGREFDATEGLLFSRKKTFRIHPSSLKFKKYLRHEDTGAFLQLQKTMERLRAAAKVWPGTASSEKGRGVAVGEETGGLFWVGGTSVTETVGSREPEGTVSKTFPKRSEGGTSRIPSIKKDCKKRCPRSPRQMPYSR